MSNPVPVIPLQYAHVPGGESQLRRRLPILALCTWLACLLAWGMIFVQVETVLGTAPLIGLLALVMLYFAARARSSRYLILGTMHCAVCLLFIALVWRFNWSPDEAKVPFGVMGAIHCIATGSATFWIGRQARRATGILA